MVCTFFTLVAPSHGNEAGQIVPPYEHAGKQLLADKTHHLEAIFLIPGVDGGKDQLVVVLEDAITEGLETVCVSSGWRRLSWDRTCFP